MKRTKRFMFLAFVLLTVAAQGFARGNRPQVQQSAQDLGARGSGQYYWLAKYQQPVTLHTVNYDYPGIPYQDGDSITNNIRVRDIKQYLNVDIVTDWVAATGSDMGTKLNLSIASGDIPDFFQCNSNHFRILMEAGLLADLTDYVENNIDDSIKETMAVMTDVTDSAKKDGRLYAIPQYGYGTITMPEIIWVRKDWREAAGVHAPKTVAELESLMQTFMRAHPGTYGMPLRDSLDEFNWLAPAFGAYPGYWITGSDDSIVFGSIQPEMKPVLQTFADWYKKGYLKQDWMSSNYDSNRSDLMTGKYGIQIFPQWWGFGMATDMMSNYGMNAYFEAFDLPSVTGEPVMHPKDFDNEGYIVVNKDCKNIAAVLKSISWYAAGNEYLADQGLRTRDQTNALFYADGMWHFMPMIKTMDAVLQREVYLQVLQTKKTGIRPPELTDQCYDNEIKPFLENGDLRGAGRWLQMWADNSAYEVTDRIGTENRWVESRMQGPVPEEIAAYGSTLDDILTEGFIQIIVGQQPISYFDTLVAQWKAAGGDNCTQVMNRVYGKK